MDRPGTVKLKNSKKRYSHTKQEYLNNFYILTMKYKSLKYFTVTQKQKSVNTNKI